MAITEGKKMKIGTQVKVKLASGEWYTGKVTAHVTYAADDVRLEVQGNLPRPFVTITRPESVVVMP